MKALDRLRVLIVSVAVSETMYCKFAQFGFWEQESCASLKPRRVGEICEIERDGEEVWMAKIVNIVRFIKEGQSVNLYKLKAPSSVKHPYAFKM